MGICRAPSEAYDGSPHTVERRMISLFGDVAEIIIKTHYCKEKGGCQEFLKPGTLQTDFFDAGMGFHRCDHLLAYLQMHNPFLTNDVHAQCLARKEPGDPHFPVPDMITTEPGRREFYEIKPDTIDGLNKAIKKVQWFEGEVCAPNGLVYSRGTRFSGAVDVPVWNGTWFGVPVKVRFVTDMPRNGVVVYKICLDRALGELLEKLLIKAVAAALIYIILTTGPVLVPAFASVFASTTESPLQQSVGSEGNNSKFDVAYAQLMLNDWRGQSEISPLLEIDGLAGPKTIGAIKLFQQSVTGIIDGRFDPHGPGVTALESLHFESLAPRATATPYMEHWALDQEEDTPLLESLAAAGQEYLASIYRAAGMLTSDPDVGGTGTPDGVGTPTLSQGSQGEAVRKLQRLLNEHAPDLPSLAVDGDFGPVTDARVREYQRRVEITVDGVVGPQTWGMLTGGEQAEEAAAGTPTLQQGSHGPAVRKLQRLLNDHLPDLQLVVDGRFGPVTDARVREFQQRVAIAVDGIVGPQTWSHLTQ
ncbi:peptidoglycan-binding protein [Streptomyces sp. NPDC057027]|uniref:peptidoglycan-binding protein n=1 Tax=Streptomyces sp. NPDC057027 TaxID=3346004 RepID=UPI0036263C87